MINSDVQVDLVINRIKRHQYEELSLSGLLDDNQIYLITDDEPLSIQISSQISSLEEKIDVIGSDYLDSSDKTDILNRCLEVDEVTLYRGPGTKEITLSVGSGSQEKEYTASLSDFVLSSEMSNVLLGKTYDIDTNEGLKSAISDLLHIFGGSIT